jgi:peptidoglycan/LPS O-acetylase OafA/YrhL
LARTESSIADERLLASGDEAGTAPGDRKFRPDVEGLRAVAVGLVVLFHAGVPHLTGGYVGVDVFFVISGFVITGLLLRERQGTGGTSILGFYARRVRRILPAATLVIVATVAAAYVVLGVVSGNYVADDGRWAAVFLANFHFEAVGTNYFTAALPPSPLQNYWSLSVEEQFYVVYPTLFLLVARVRGRFSLRTRMSVALGVVIVASYWLSVTQTASHPASAYFSPFTRAWELALGALVAVSTTWLKHLPAQMAALLTWAGLAAILYSAFAFDARTVYPGSLVAVPVVGAALIIAGGVAAPSTGTESLLGLPPFQWLGKRSYSLYLWHWPILIIAAEQVGKTSLPVGDNLILVVFAVILSMASYRLVENPIRHWRLPTRTSVVAGVALVLSTVLVLSLAIDAGSASPTHNQVVPASNEQVVLDQVAAAAKITTVPKDLQPSLSEAAADWGGNYESGQCQADQSQSSEHICTLGDPYGTKLMVVYGDSHALMWLPAFEAIAKAAGWRLVVLGKVYCPAEPVTIANQPVWSDPGGPDLSCDQWHRWAAQWINVHKPGLLVITQFPSYLAPRTNGSPPVAFTEPQWLAGFKDLIDSIHVPGMRETLLGTTPTLAQSGPFCLAEHPNDVQLCSTPALQSEQIASAEHLQALATGIGYVSPLPWFCSAVCTAVIDKYNVYLEGIHISATWARYLENVLARSLGFPASET